MSNRKASRDGSAFAEIFSRVSRGLKWLPPINSLLVGNNNVPDGWQHTTDNADDIGSWVRFYGDATGSVLPIPRLFRKAGILAVSKSEIEELQDRHNGSRQAVVLKFGQAVVVGALKEGVTFSNDPNDNSMLLVGARIGSDDLNATTGIWVPAERRLVVAETTRYAGRPYTENVPPELTLV